LDIVRLKDDNDNKLTVESKHWKS